MAIENILNGGSLNDLYMDLFPAGRTNIDLMVRKIYHFTIITTGRVCGYHLIIKKR